jgi:hypothetical protein
MQRLEGLLDRDTQAERELGSVGLDGEPVSEEHRDEAVARVASRASLLSAIRELAEDADRLEDWQEREAKVCPEDFGFEEYISSLTSAVDRAHRELYASQAEVAELKRLLIASHSRSPSTSKEDDTNG